MIRKLPDRVIEVIIKALENDTLIQKQARLCDLAALDAIPLEILPHLKLHHQKAIAILPKISSRILLSLTGSQYKEVKLTILKLKNISPTILRILSEDSDLDILRMVLINPQTPGEILIKYKEYYPQKNIYGDRINFTPEIAANRVSTSAKTLRQLSLDKSWTVRSRVARNPNTPIDVLEKLANDPLYSGAAALGISYVRQSVTENPNTPIEILEKLANDSGKAVRQCATAAIAERKEKSSKDSNNINRNHSKKPVTPHCKHPYLSSETLNKYSTDSDPRVKIDVAGNCNTPSETLHQIYLDTLRNTNLKSGQLKNIQKEIASNPNTPTKTLNQIFLEKRKSKDVMRIMAGNLHTPIELLEELAENKDYSIAKILVQNTNTPPNLLRKLSAEYSYNGDIQQLIVQNYNTPTDLLEQLTQHRNYWVKWSVAEKINNPLPIIEKLSRCKDRYVKEKAINRLHSIYKEKAANPETSLEELQKMLNNQDIEIRQAVTLHPQGLNLLLDRCLKPERHFPKQNSLHRVLTGMYPEISREQMDNLFHSDNWFDRLSVVCNPKISKEYLAQLAEDENTVIKETARELLLESNN